MIDNLLTFTSLSGALTADAAVAKAIDFGVGRNLGVSPDPLYLIIQVKVAAATTSGTGIFALKTGPTIGSTGFLESTGRVTVFSTKTLSLADLALDKKLVFPLPYADYKRYLQLDWDEVATLTALKVAAWLDTRPEYYRAFPDAQN